MTYGYGMQSSSCDPYVLETFNSNTLWFYLYLIYNHPSSLNDWESDWNIRTADVDNILENGVVAQHIKCVLKAHKKSVDEEVESEYRGKAYLKRHVTFLLFFHIYTSTNIRVFVLKNFPRVICE